MAWRENSEREVARLKMRVAQLERELTRLRASRRVLLELVAFQDRQQRFRIGALERENRRLRHRRPFQP
ncbi:hypothetical protein [Sulfobacillus harzensis]|uniref:Translation initiation factor 2 n=1 Tax=Sulfobacillus harzensis TaxID=2729629 RepID=A0A7Y0Q0B4_9FIRM|nr:hypothetical protein [Sulfobacillus harzensis]NMP20823.1 hypothetical protein [Sulfobacillus harzensis]